MTGSLAPQVENVLELIGGAPVTILPDTGERYFSLDEYFQEQQ